MTYCISAQSEFKTSFSIAEARRYAREMSRRSDYPVVISVEQDVVSVYKNGQQQK